MAKTSGGSRSSVPTTPSRSATWKRSPRTGYELVRTECTACDSPVNIAHISEDALREAVRKVDGADIDAIVQFGANLPMAYVAAEAERWLGKPVIAVMTATYWHALRHNGIADRTPGFGRLMELH